MENTNVELQRLKQDTHEFDFRCMSPTKIVLLFILLFKTQTK